MSNNFLTKWFQRDYSPIGLDIGHDSVKMLQLCRRGGRWQVSAGGIHAFGEQVRQSPNLRWRFAGDAIGSLMRNPGKSRFRGNRVVACLDNEQVVIKNARLPKMPPTELHDAVRWEAAERFPFDIGAGMIRFLVAGEVRQGGEERQEVLMFATSDQTLRESIRLIEQAGCKPVGLDSQPIALARALNFFTPAEDKSVQVLADLGGQTCQVIIIRDGQILFTKTIEIGSNDLTRAVVEKVGTTFEDTAALRMRLGSQGPEGPGDGNGEDSKVHRAVSAAMRPVIERLAHEITLCLRYYSVTFRGDRPNGVTFVGGASHDRLLIHLVGEALGLEARVGGPLSSCVPDWSICQWGAGPDAGGPEWAIALGCCLKPAVMVDAATAKGGAEPEPISVGGEPGVGGGEPAGAAVAGHSSLGTTERTPTSPHEEARK